MAHDTGAGYRHGNAQHSDCVRRTSVGCDSNHDDDVGRDGDEPIETNIKAKSAAYLDGETQ